MTKVSNLLVAGFGTIIAGLLVLLALTLNYVLYGHWFALSLVDTITLLSPGATVSIGMLVSESDVSYFIFADAPQYAVLMVVGMGLLIAHVLKGRD